MSSASDQPDSSPKQPFAGFDIPRQNWFKMPNNWTDITADISSLAELKVVEYVLKHTWGFQEYGVRKRITNDEFMNGRKRKDKSRMDCGTGLSKKSVIAGLKLAVEHELLIEEVDDSDKARVKKYYSLKMATEPDTDNDDDPSPNEPPPPETETDRVGVKNGNAGVKKVYPGVTEVYPRGEESIPRTEKETLERNLQEEKNNNNTDDAETQPTDVVVAFLLEQGIAKGVAERLASRYSYDRVAQKIEFLAYLQDVEPQKVKNPQGWLRRAIEEDYAAPDGYTSVAEREAEAAEKLRQEEAIQHAIAEQEQHRRAEQAQRQQAAAARLAALQTEYGTTQQEHDLWQQVLAEFKVSQPAGTFGSYLADTVLLSLRDGEALIGLPNVWMRDWVENRLSHKIGQSLSRYLDGQKVTPKFIALSQAEATAVE